MVWVGDGAFEGGFSAAELDDFSTQFELSDPFGMGTFEDKHLQVEFFEFFAQVTQEFFNSLGKEFAVIDECLWFWQDGLVGIDGGLECVEFIGGDEIRGQLGEPFGGDVVYSLAVICH